MTHQSFSANVSSAIKQPWNLMDSPNFEPAKHQILDSNSVLLKITPMNDVPIKSALRDAVFNHFNHLWVLPQDCEGILKKIDTLDLQPGQMLLVKKEENDSISLSFAKERKIRIGKFLGRAIGNLTGSTSQQSERSSFGGLLGNRFIVEKPVMTLTKPTQAGTDSQYDSDDDFSMIALADTPEDPPGELMQGESFAYPDIDAPGPAQHHYVSPYASLPIITEGSVSSDDEPSTTALSGHTHQHGPGPDTDTQHTFSLKPPTLGVAKKIPNAHLKHSPSTPLVNKNTVKQNFYLNSPMSHTLKKQESIHENQQLSTLVESAYQESKPQDRLQVAIAGHGSLDVNYESFEIPPNVTIRTWRIPGQVLSDPIGKQIEELRPGESVIIKQNHSDYLYETIFKPGDKIPNYAVYPPTGLNISHESITVSNKTSLSEIIKEQVENYNGAPMQIEFSACQSYSIPTFGKNEGQNIENLRTRLGILQREVSEFVNEPKEKQNPKILTYLCEALDDLKKDFTRHKTQYNQQKAFELCESTGEVIGDADYVNFILSEISTALGDPNLRVS
jgi:hypothetical protein